MRPAPPSRTRGAPRVAGALPGRVPVVARRGAGRFSAASTRMTFGPVSEIFDSDSNFCPPGDTEVGRVGTFITGAASSMRARLAGGGGGAVMNLRAGGGAAGPAAAPPCGGDPSARPARGELTSRGGSFAESPATGASFELRPAITRGIAGRSGAALGALAATGAAGTTGAGAEIGAAGTGTGSATTGALLGRGAGVASCDSVVVGEDGAAACAGVASTDALDGVGGVASALVAALSTSTATFFAVFRTAFLGASIVAVESPALPSLTEVPEGVPIGVVSVTFARIERGLGAVLVAVATAPAAPLVVLSPCALDAVWAVAASDVAEAANHSRIVSASPNDTTALWSLKLGRSSATHRAMMSLELTPNSFAS